MTALLGSNRPIPSSNQVWLNNGIITTGTNLTVSTCLNPGTITALAGFVGGLLNTGTNDEHQSQFSRVTEWHTNDRSNHWDDLDNLVMSIQQQVRGQQDGCKSGCALQREFLLHSVGEDSKSKLMKGRKT